MQKQCSCCHKGGFYYHSVLPYNDILAKYVIANSPIKISGSDILHAILESYVILDVRLYRSSKGLV